MAARRRPQLTAEETEKIIKKAYKILRPHRLDPKDPRPIRGDPGDISGEVYHLTETCAALRRYRSRDSKESTRAVKVFAAALRKATNSYGGLPEDLCLSFGLYRLAYNFKVYEKYWGKDLDVATLKDGKVRVAPKPRKPKPDAYEKRLAAEAALLLCEKFDVKPTTTKRESILQTSGGTLRRLRRRTCRLAASLQGGAQSTPTREKRGQRNYLIRAWVSLIVSASKKTSTRKEKHDQYSS